MPSSKLTPDRLLSCGILQKWHAKSLEDFTNDPAAKKAVLKYLSQHRAVRKDGTGLYLHGANGVGKTLLMNASFKWLMEQGYKVQIISLSSLITKFTAGWYDMEEKRALQQTLQRVDFLGIEEIGKEFKSQTSDLAVTVLDNIVRYRSQMLKPIWATSNLEAKKLSDTYSEDIASMLREACIPINVLGEDFRERIAKELKKKYL